MGILNTDGKAILVAFIGILVAVTFISPIANSVDTQTSIYRVDNATYTVSSTVNGTTDLTGRALITRVAITNATEPLDIPSLTLQTGTGTNGLRSVQLLNNDTSNTDYAGKSVNVSYTYEPDGYLPISGARSVASLIILFGALAIVVFALVSFMKDGSLKELLRR